MILKKKNNFAFFSATFVVVLLLALMVAPGSLKRKGQFWADMMRPKKQILQTLEESFLLTAQDVSHLYILVEKLHQFFADHQLDYFAESGTLLGAVRHQGVIPWDDDVDVSLLQKDKNRFLAASKGLGQIGLVLTKETGESQGYKIFHPQRPHVWVDIFFVKPFDDGYVRYAHQNNRKLWPNHGHRYRDLFDENGHLNLATVSFGPTRIRVPRHAKPYLNRAYPGWKRFAVISCHRLGYMGCVPFIRFPELLKGALWDQKLFDQETGRSSFA